MAAVLDDMQPDVILIDAGMQRILDDFPGGSKIADWMHANEMREAAAVSDPTYGTIRIFRRSPRPAYP
jgi:hypothetical protein